MEEKEEIAAEVMQEMQEMLETDGGSEDEPPAIVRCGGTMIGGTPPAECFSVRK